MEDFIILQLVIIAISLLIGGSIVFRLMRGLLGFGYPSVYPTVVQPRVPNPPPTTQNGGSSVGTMFLLLLLVGGLFFFMIDDELDSEYPEQEDVVTDTIAGSVKKEQRLKIVNQSPSAISKVIEKPVRDIEYAIQLLSSDDFDELEKEQSIYTSKGFDSYIISQSEDFSYKLVIGFFATYEAAKDFEALHFSKQSSWVREVDFEVDYVVGE
jgi:hypothetical protein